MQFNNDQLSNNILYLMTETNYIQTSLHFFKLASVAQGTRQVLQISSPCLKIAA